jgi:MYXO-CTERM domain-containing protein
LASAAFEPVPEPATYGYCAMLGLLGLVVLRRRRESQK